MNICICGNLLYFEEMTQIAVGETLKGNFILMPINKISKKYIELFDRITSNQFEKRDYIGINDAIELNIKNELKKYQ